MKAFRAGLLVVLIAPLAGPAAAQDCEVGEHARIPGLQDLPYAEARERLVAAGWQPLLVNPTHRDDGSAESGNGPAFLDQCFHDVEDCAGSGLAQCAFYADAHGNVLKVVTAGEELPANGLRAGVVRWFFDCGEEWRRTEAPPESLAAAGRGSLCHP